MTPSWQGVGGDPQAGQAGHVAKDREWQVHSRALSTGMTGGMTASTRQWPLTNGGGQGAEDQPVCVLEEADPLEASSQPAVGQP